MVKNLHNGIKICIYTLCVHLLYMQGFVKGLWGISGDDFIGAHQNYTAIVQFVACVYLREEHIAGYMDRPSVSSPKAAI